MSKNVCTFAVAYNSITIYNIAGMNTPDPTALKGHDLFVYCTKYHPNMEFREVAAMLPGAVMSMEKACSILERVVAKKQIIKCHYPAHDNPKNIVGKEILGDIPDGCLYIV